MIQVNIVTYGYGVYLGHCIESVLSQTVKPDRILVIDDCSGEDIRWICDKFNVEYIIRDRNLGTVENFRDILLNHTDTDRCFFLGADNWIHPLYIEKLSSKNADIVSSDIVLVGQERAGFASIVRAERSGGYYIWKFKHGDIENSNYIHGSSIYNVQKAKNVGGYERNRLSKNTEEDWMLWRKMIKTGATHTHVNEPLLYYRRHRLNHTKI